jgi:hypothetical protein
MWGMAAKSGQMKYKNEYYTPPAGNAFAVFQESK